MNRKLTTINNIISQAKELTKQLNKTVFPASAQKIINESPITMLTDAKFNGSHIVKDSIKYKVCEQSSRILNVTEPKAGQGDFADNVSLFFIIDIDPELKLRIYVKALMPVQHYCDMIKDMSPAQLDNMVNNGIYLDAPVYAYYYHKRTNPNQVGKGENAVLSVNIHL